MVFLVFWVNSLHNLALFGHRLGTFFASGGVRCFWWRFLLLVASVASGGVFCFWWRPLLLVASVAFGDGRCLWWRPLLLVASVAFGAHSGCYNACSGCCNTYSDGRAQRASERSEPSARSVYRTRRAATSNDGSRHMQQDAPGTCRLLQDNMQRLRQRRHAAAYDNTCLQAAPG